LSKEQDQLYYGGPVSLDSLVFVFRAPVMAREALHVTDDVYLSMSPEILAGLLRRDAPTQDLRVFRGYAGWAPGQIEAEIARGDWHVLAAEPDVIFSEEPDRLWEEMIIRATALQARAQPDGYAASIAAR
jgi:putative transcriptional regulator